MAERRVMEASVVVPTRNRSRLLATTLRSVLAQRDVELEVIVVDEASTDDTRAVVEAFSDPRLRLVHHAEPLGPNAARNRGARAAGGEWLAFVDDDDVWAPDKLARQLRAAREAGRAWAYAGSVNVDERLEVIHGVPPPPPAEVLAQLPRHNVIPASASNVVVRRDAFASLGGFDERLRTCEEWELWIRLAGVGPPAWAPSPLVAYRMHPGNAILDVAAIIDGARMIERMHGTSIDWGRFHWWVGQLCLRGGRRREALGQYARAALRGRGREALADLRAVARRSLRRRLGGPGVPPSRPADAWHQEARSWLSELAATDAGPAGGPP